MIGAVLAATTIAAVVNYALMSACGGVAVVFGVAISFTNLAVAINPASLLTVSFLSGAMATLTSVGAPPMGLLYQRQRSDMYATPNAFFLSAFGQNAQGVCQGMHHRCQDENSDATDLYGQWREYKKRSFGQGPNPSREGGNGKDYQNDSDAEVGFGFRLQLPLLLIMIDDDQYRNEAEANKINPPFGDVAERGEDTERRHIDRYHFGGDELRELLHRGVLLRWFASGRFCAREREFFLPLDPCRDH
jgi:hypothetical protein